MNPPAKVLFFGIMLAGYAGLVSMTSDAVAFTPPIGSLDWWLPLKTAVFVLPVYMVLVAWRHRIPVNTDFFVLVVPMAAWFIAFSVARRSGWWGLGCRGRACEHAGKEMFKFFIVEPSLVLLISGAYLARFLVVPSPSSPGGRLLIAIISDAVPVACLVPALPD